MFLGKITNTVNTEEQNSYCAGQVVYVFFIVENHKTKKLDFHRKTSKNDSVILFKVHIVGKPAASCACDIWHLCWNEQKESNKRRFHTI